MSRIESMKQLIPLHCALYGCDGGHAHIHLLFGFVSFVPPGQGETNVFVHDDGEVFRSATEYLISLS